MDWNSESSTSPTHLKPYGGGNVVLWISVLDVADATSQTLLTDMFSSIGGAPKLGLSNGTHHFHFQSSNFTVICTL